MSFEWEATTLGEVCLKITDGAHASPASVLVGKPMASVKDLTRFGVDLSSARLIANEDFEALVKQGCKPQVGDVLVAKDGNSALDTVCTVTKPLDAVLLSSVAILRPNPLKVNAEFLKYYLSSRDVIAYLKANFISGAAIPRVVLRDFKKAKISLPPMEVQVQIASILSALDDRIALLQETNTTLEAIAQALFKSWFVDFGPVYAKQAGRPPEGIDEMTAALFPDSFDESTIGPVPKGWQVASLADAFDINPKRSLKRAVSAPYLDMASLSTSGHCVEAPIQRDMGSGAKYRNGDTLLARITPCLENGKSAFVDFLADGQVGWGSTEFLVLRPKAPLPEYFGYLLCRHPAFREHAIQSMSGTSGRQRVQNDVLGRYLLALADENVASAFSGIVEALQKSIAENHEKAGTLAEIRNELLPRLISGRLRQLDAKMADKLKAAA